MNSIHVDRFARQYATQYEITEQQAHTLVSNALGQDASGKLLVFALALLTHQVDIDTILKAMAFGEAAWYRSAELTL
jgi:hypothetical protein